MGEHHRRAAPLYVADHEFVGIGAHHLDDLVPQRVARRLKEELAR